MQGQWQAGRTSPLSLLGAEPGATCAAGAASASLPCQLLVAGVEGLVTQHLGQQASSAHPRSGGDAIRGDNQSVDHRRALILRQMLVCASCIFLVFMVLLFVLQTPGTAVSGKTPCARGAGAASKSAILDWRTENSLIGAAAAGPCGTWWGAVLLLGIPATGPCEFERRSRFLPRRIGVIAAGPVSQRVCPAAGAREGHNAAGLGRAKAGGKGPG